MTDLGEKAVETAKKNGMWDASPSGAIAEEQIAAFEDKLSGFLPAYENFSKMPRSTKVAYVCVDFRVSSILFEAVAITIADGSNSYPVNNVTMYDAWQSGIPQYPQYVGEKHYGYLLDESGKVKVNTESKLTPFAFYTTAIADLKNPVVENVELE